MQNNHCLNIHKGIYKTKKCSNIIHVQMLTKKRIEKGDFNYAC